MRILIDGWEEMTKMKESWSKLTSTGWKKQSIEQKLATCQVYGMEEKAIKVIYQEE